MVCAFLCEFSSVEMIMIKIKTKKCHSARYFIEALLHMLLAVIPLCVVPHREAVGMSNF